MAERPLQSFSACTVQLYFYSPYWPYGLYRASVPVQYSYTSTPPIDRTACTVPHCLYKVALYLTLPYLTFGRDRSIKKSTSIEDGRVPLLSSFQGMFLKVQTQHNDPMPYNTCTFDPNRSLTNGYLREEQCTFWVLSLPYNGKR